MSTPDEAENTRKRLQEGKVGREEMGEVRRKYFTREYPRVKECGHKFVPGNLPHSGCEHCWFTYFVDNEQLLKQTLDIMHKVGEEAGLKALTGIHGKQWVREFKKFVTTLAMIRNLDAAAAQALVNQVKTEEGAA